MTINYLAGKPWSDWSREERFFCSVLYHLASKDQATKDDFAAWLIKEAGLTSVRDKVGWELGYEVCFYRDYLHGLKREVDPQTKLKRKTAREQGLPVKRTFDLCLFGPKTIIIIEAKCAEGFDTKQLGHFRDDLRIIRDEIPELAEVNVELVALASSAYVQDSKVLKTEPFTGKPITWLQVYEKYGDAQLQRADELYAE